jgi:hypothetical protein
MLDKFFDMVVGGEMVVRIKWELQRILVCEKLMILGFIFLKTKICITCAVDDLMLEGYNHKSWDVAKIWNLFTGRVEEAILDVPFQFGSRGQIKGQE